MTCDVHDSEALGEDCSLVSEMVSERSIGYIETRVDQTTLKSDNSNERSSREKKLN